MIRIIGNEYFLPTHYCEDELPAEEQRVLASIKNHVAETGKSVYASKLIKEFGHYHSRLETYVWDCKPVISMIDKGAVAVVASHTPAFIS
ncbi:hypothetical protein O3W44_22290 [Pantoea sp. LMR881]|uniref:hypothetical protein n=1 Tax=Pantoea sp. LMR881 TaxID=3014336 RepID=UPI0022B07B7A|nr:hypothetical protein [Pantoea sp. LMR881]MCZ4061263.1 hypothetical protein [Pantoea sp. LMR881]